MFNSPTVPVSTLLPSQIEAAAQQLIQESMTDPWGDISPAIYDTARSLLLPRSLQPKGCLEFLLQEQMEDGSWGGPDAYCLVPSLSATASLLHLTLLAAQGEEITEDTTDVSRAAWRGLDFLALSLPNVVELPKLAASKLTVPALVQEIEETLAALAKVVS